MDNDEYDSLDLMDEAPKEVASELIEQTHPRLTQNFISPENDHGLNQDATFLEAYNRQRLHHAWLLCGPQGLGKATFAYRVARFLMGHIKDPNHGPLGMSAQDPDVRLIEAQSHPDLLVLEPIEGKKNITVDAVRTIGEFFSKAPSRSAYRLCIIDAVDDLNNNGANALLKILEEPPERGLIFLISHSPGKLLPTIRSRCRRLSFNLWDDEAVRDFVAQRTPARNETLDRLCSLAKGAPGRAIRLWQMGAIDMDAWVTRWLLGDVSLTEINRFATEMRSKSLKAQVPQRFQLFIECLQSQIRDRALSAPNSDKARQWAEVWQAMDQIVPETEGLNQDRGDRVLDIMQKIKNIA